VLGLLGVLGALVIWEALPRLGLVSPDDLPPATVVLQALASQAVTPEFWRAVLDTLVAWAIGLGIATVAAVALGFLVGSVPVLREFTRSTVEFLRPIPSIALIPLAVLLFATDIRSTLLLVVYACFWQVYIQVLHGVADTDPVAEETARSYRFGRWARIRYVTVPSALPYILVGFRLAAAVALILAITAEMIIGSPGLGQQIGTAREGGARPEVVYSIVLVIGAIGVLVNVGVRFLERRVLHWHTSVRGEAAL
jgi:ABC-type nitrate/sulfonate/bicarbonate transport system permease component